MSRYCILAGAALFLFTHQSLSQELPPQGLVMYRNFGGAIFEYTKDTTTYTVSPRQVLQIMHDDPLAYAEFKKARSYYRAEGVLGFAGGVLALVPVGTAIAGGDPEWALAAGGAALILASIPFNKAYKRHAQHAIETFNKNKTAFRPKPELYLSGAGIKVVIRF
jgi:hypothetical protein